TLSQDIVTTPGQHYVLTLYVVGDAEASTNSLSVNWDGATVLSVGSVTGGFTQYTLDLVGDATQSTTHLDISGFSDGTGVLLDRVAIGAVPGPATESADGSVTFSDPEAGDTHTANFVAQAGDYVGSFSLDAVSESGGNGSIGWHFSVHNADIQFLGQGQSLTQVYTVFITDEHGATVGQDVTVTINGSNDAPTAVGETVVSDAGASGVIDIPAWALAFNDIDP